MSPEFVPRSNFYIWHEGRLRAVTRETAVEGGRNHWKTCDICRPVVEAADFLALLEMDELT